MVIPKVDSREEDFKKLLKQIARICLSEEFLSLRQELEGLYNNSDLENAMVAAFQDALYSILAQEEAITDLKQQAF